MHWQATNHSVYRLIVCKCICERLDTRVFWNIEEVDLNIISSLVHSDLLKSRVSAAQYIILL